MKKTALILIEGNSTGNGRAFARSARHLGFVPVMLSRDPHRYDYIEPEGIQAVVVNTAEVGTVIEACEALKSSYEIAGVTCASESYYKSVAIVCRHLGLPGPNPDAVERCLDKSTQRELLTQANIPMPGYRPATTAAEAEKFAAEIGFPVVVKPIAGNGSTGVKLCRTGDDVAEQAAFILAGKHGLPPPSRVLVEEYAIGPYYCCEMMGGEIVGYYTASFGELPSFAVREFAFQTSLANGHQDPISAVAVESIEALGLDWGPVNIEMRMTRLGPVVIEVNPRIGGAPGPELVQLASGVDLIAQTIRAFTGQQPDLTKTCSRVAAGRYVMPERDGILEWVGDQRRARAVPGVSTIDLKAKSGKPIVLQGDWRDIIAHVVAVSSDADKVTATVQQAVDLMEWIMAPLPTAERRRSA